VDATEASRACGRNVQEVWMHTRSASLRIATVLVLLSPPTLRAQVAPPGCDGHTAGSVTLSETTALVFVVVFSGERAYLEVAFLARGDAGWNAEELTFQPWRRPKLPEPTGFLTGAAAGRLFMQYDQAASTAWVDTQKIHVQRGTVLIVDDAHTNAPVVRAVLRMDPTIPLSDACRVREANDHEALRAALLARLLRVPVLRDVIREPVDRRTSARGSTAGDWLPDGRFAASGCQGTC
jgi:hypothetical protein